MFKINLPNPADYNPEDFFKQMRIVIKSAELSYKEMVKGLELNDDNTPFIIYRHPHLESELEKNYKLIPSNKNIIEFGEDDQEIELEINQL